MIGWCAPLFPQMQRTSFQWILLPILIFLLAACEADPDRKVSRIAPDLRNGDLIFQTSTSRQSQAIQLATGSKYSHVGLIYKKGDRTLVLEAVQPVKLTPLNEWIDRGQDDHYVVKRLKNAEEILTNEVLDRMALLAQDHIGRDYDLHFEWSDERIYCSELVWKLYREAAGVELSKLQRLKDFDLSHPDVRSIMVERYGENFPLDEPVVSPAGLYDSALLENVP